MFSKDDSQKKNNRESQQKSKQKQPQQQSYGEEGSKSLEDISSSSSSVVVFNPEKRRIRVDYRIKYAYLDYVTGIDLLGLQALAEDIRQSLQVLDNSYLAIVNSLSILNERKKRKESSSLTAIKEATERETSSSVPSTNSKSTSYTDFINSKVAENFRQSDTESLSSYPDTYEWTIDKFCDPETRDQEFQHLFKDSKAYIATVHPIVTRKTKINMTRFGALVRQGKSLLGIIELLNTNYSNNFLDIFRLS